MKVDLTWRGEQIKARLDAAIRDGIDTTTAQCDANSKQLTNRSNGSGRTYRKGASRATYQASAPGEPPAKPTGLLQGSITSRPATRVGNRWVGEWGVGAGRNAGGLGYAFWLEIGTAKMAARPYLRPSAEQEYPKLAGRIKRLFDKGGVP